MFRYFLGVGWGNSPWTISLISIEYLLYLRYLKCLMIMVFGICCDNVATHSPMVAMFFWPVQDRYPWMPGIFGSSPQWLQALIAIGFFGFSWQSCCGCTSMKNKQTCLSSLWQSFHVTLWSNDKCKDLMYIYKQCNHIYLYVRLHLFTYMGHFKRKSLSSNHYYSGDIR